jgi:hypothetical protein
MSHWLLPGFVFLRENNTSGFKSHNFRSCKQQIEPFSFMIFKLKSYTLQVRKLHIVPNYVLDTDYICREIEMIELEDK